MEIDGERLTIGCWCYMILKAFLPEAECWLHQQDPEAEFAWPKKLNGVPIR